jgi:hypothetical protein
MLFPRLARPMPIAGKYYPLSEVFAGNQVFAETF